MRIPTEVENKAIDLLTQMEASIVKEYAFSNSVILAMNSLKQALDNDEQLKGKELQELYNRLNNSN